MAASSRPPGVTATIKVTPAADSTLAAETHEEEQQYQVFLLSGPDDPQTVRLAQPIGNDSVSRRADPRPGHLASVTPVSPN